MANIYVNTIGVPRKPRNKRIYGGNSFVVTNASSSNETAVKHFEIATLNNLDSKNVEITFTEEFDYTPTIIEFKVYRMFEFATDKWIEKDVLKYHDSENWYDKSGFSLVIDSSESLTGVIIRYGFA